jgi:hypothetical protein
VKHPAKTSAADSSSAHGTHLASLGAIGLLVVLATMVFAVASASAALHPFISSFVTGAAPQSVAVDPSGDVYVLSQAFGQIEKFDASGAPVNFSSLGSNALTGAATPAGSFAFAGGASQLAVDDSTGAAAGDLYVTDTSHNVVDVFDSNSGAYLGQLTEAGGSPLAEPCGVAVDPSGKVYVAGFFGTVARFVPTASPPTDADYDSQLGVGFSSCGLAADSNGAVYVRSVFETNVTRYAASEFGGAGTGQVLTTGALSVATDPSNDDAYASQATSIAQFTAAGGSLGSFGAGHLGEPLAVAISPGGRVYVANSAEGSVSIFGPTPPAVPPTVVSQNAIPTESEAQLVAKIDPGFDALTYRFEYGPTAGYGNSTTAVAVPASESLDSASSRIQALQPGTTYHFRVVAQNSVERAAGPDQTFTTQSPPSGGCANEVFRVGPSVRLPECRAYEQVSPVEKQGEDVLNFEQGFSLGFDVTSSPDGEAVTYQATGAFPGSPTSLQTTAFLSSRLGSSWATQTVTPVQGPPQVFINRTATLADSADLSKSIVFSTRALAPGGIGGNSNLYLRDNTTGDFELMATTEEPEETIFPNDETPVVGANADLTHVLLRARARLLPEAPTVLPFAYNVYEWSAGSGLRLINWLPGEPETVVDAAAGNGNPRALGSYGNPMSTDGSRVFFASLDAGGESTLYLREGGHTIPITASNPALKHALFEYATPDGSEAYFVAGEPGGRQTTLYRYDVGTRSITDLSPATNPGEVGEPGVNDKGGGVTGVSADGTSVYFRAKGALTPDAEPLFATILSNLYLSREGHLTLAVARVWGGQMYARVRPGGDELTFSSTAPLTGYDNSNPSCVGGICQELYVYSPDRQPALACISCDPSGAAPHGDATFSEVEQGAVVAPQFPHFFLEDGQIFFNSPDSLVPNDVNGQQDVYEYREGAVHLISAGIGTQKSTFGDADASGRNVFFLTRDRLVSQDIDENVDIYDARIEGGLPGASAPTSCVAAECRTAIAPAPSAVSPSSASVSGSGNVPKAQPKHHVKPKHHKKKRAKHQKKHGRDQKKRSKKGGTHSKRRAANRNAGGSK